MPDPVGKKQEASIIIAGVVGNVMEWYDFALYGYFAATIGKQFFPSEDPTTSLIASFGVFAAGFLMRPIGAAFFGHLGDRLGRKKALMLSVILMALPTFILGCLPTYEQIGVSAAVLLTIVRLVQGFSVGGEFTGSVTYVVETAPTAKRGIAGSWTIAGAIGGILLGSAVAAVVTSTLSSQAVETWGWRIPFLVGICVGFFAFYIRKGLPESESFEKVRKSGEVAKIPLVEAIRSNGKEMFQVAGFCWGFSVLFYLPFVYMPTYVSTELNLPLHDALYSNTIGMIVLLALIPVMGMISDRVGRKKLIAISLICLAIASYPLFLWLKHETFVYVVLAQVGFAILVSVLQGATPAFLVETFDSKARYSALSVSYNISLGIFGGTAPLVSTWLLKTTGYKYSPSLYLVATALISLVALASMRDRTGEDL